MSNPTPLQSVAIEVLRALNPGNTNANDYLELLRQLVRLGEEISLADAAFTDAASSVESAFLDWSDVLDATEEPDPACRSCDGTGEGQFEDQSCTACRGKGLVAA